MSGPHPSLVDQIDALADLITRFTMEPSFETLPWMDQDDLNDVRLELEAYSKLLSIKPAEQAVFLARVIADGESALAYTRRILEQQTK